MQCAVAARKTGKKKRNGKDIIFINLSVGRPAYEIERRCFRSDKVMQ
jgi:hypothetical protein